MGKVLSDKFFLLSVFSILIGFVAVLGQSISDLKTEEGSMSLYLFVKHVFDALKGLPVFLAYYWSLVVCMLILVVRVFVKAKYIRVGLLVASVPTILFVTYFNFELIGGYFQGAAFMGHVISVGLLPLKILPSSFLAGVIVAGVVYAFDEGQA